MSSHLGLLTLMALSACQEPFGADRHDLLGFRVAAVGATANADGTLTLTPAVLVEGRPWSDAAVEFAWYYPDDAQAATIASLGPDQAVASGPLHSVRGPKTVALIARSGPNEWRGALELSDTSVVPPRFTSIELFGLDLTVDDVTVDDLSLDGRRQIPDGAPAPFVPEGGFIRLRARVEREATVRWMATAPSGTFFELDAGAADWAAGHLRVDDDEIEEREPQAPGPRTVVALALHPTRSGANTWRASEVFVGPPPPGIYTPSGRWIGTDAEVPGALVRGTLVMDDEAPTGLRLVDVEAATAEDDTGTGSLPCIAPVQGTFNPDWLLEQRCTRAAIAGARVVVESVAR